MVREFLFYNEDIDRPIFRSLLMPTVYFSCLLLSRSLWPMLAIFHFALVVFIFPPRLDLTVMPIA